MSPSQKTFTASRPKPKHSRVGLPVNELTRAALTDNNRKQNRTETKLSQVCMHTPTGQIVRQIHKPAQKHSMPHNNQEILLATLIATMTAFQATNASKN